MRQPFSLKKGYVLMEVMLSAGIFVIAGVGLATALNDIAKNYVEARRISSIRMELASRLAEARLQRLETGKETEAKDSQGVVYIKEIAPMEFKRTNRVLTLSSEVPMQGYYRVTITAQWMEGKVPQSEVAEVYAYQP